MYFVHSWNTGLVAIWIADLVSQNIEIGPVRVTPRSVSNPFNQTTWEKVATKLLYSASAWASRDGGLFLFPGNRWISKFDQETSDWFSCINTKCPVSIRICCETGFRISWHEYTKARRLFDLLNDFYCSKHERYFRRMHVLTKELNCKGNIWTSYGQIQKSSYQSFTIT